MTTESIDVTVRYSCGAYSARIGRARGSSTADRETAVRRCAERHAAARGMALIRIERLGTQRYRVFFGRPA